MEGKRVVYVESLVYDLPFKIENEWVSGGSVTVAANGYPDVTVSIQKHRDVMAWLFVIHTDIRDDLPDVVARILLHLDHGAYVVEEDAPFKLKGFSYEESPSGESVLVRFWFARHYSVELELPLEKAEVTVLDESELSRDKRFKKGRLTIDEIGEFDVTVEESYEFLIELEIDEPNEALKAWFEECFDPNVITKPPIEIKKDGLLTIGRARFKMFGLLPYSVKGPDRYVLLPDHFEEVTDETPTTTNA